jgi:small conductance mechanosensitive channel
LTWLSTEGVKLLIGAIVLFIAFKIINLIAKKFKKTMEKKNRDKTITKVGYSIIRKGGKLLVFLGFLGYVGIDTAGIGSIIASLGVGVGLAVQGSLSNLAGGLIILLMRPFRIGDYIEAQGEGGTVEDIQIFYTYIVTPDNKVIMIPNGSLANGNIRNYSTKEFRRVDFEFSISYDEDFERAKKVIWEVIENTEFVLMDPQPFVRVKTHGESTINIVTRVWTKNEHYWDVYFDMMESIKTNFDKSNIEIPYNQLDVHIKEK